MLPEGLGKPLDCHNEQIRRLIPDEPMPLY